MKRQIIILAAILAVAAGVSAQSILRPPPASTCDDCPALDSLSCQLWPEACAACWATCGDIPGEPPRRVSTFGPPYDPWLADYRLPQTVGVTMVYHEDIQSNPAALRQTTNLDFAWDAWASGFNVIKLWSQEHPFNCGGDWSWSTYWGVTLTTLEDDCSGEDMMRFWREVPQEVVFYRPQWSAWSGVEDTDAGRLTHVQGDFYAIARRLYEEIGYRHLTVVLTDWEQDHLYAEYPDYTLDRIEQRQADVMRARREAYLELRHRPNLRVMHAVIVNRYPANGGVEGAMLAEQIPTLRYRPDLIGLSYWTKGVDPVETLKWLRATTGYGPGRVYIDELGATEGQQAERFASYIPALWEWGTPIVNVWLWKQTWCDSNMGLWKQQQPCAGKVAWGDPTDGYYVIRELNEGR